MKYEIHATWPVGTFDCLSHMKGQTHTIDHADSPEEAEMIRKALAKNGFSYGLKQTKPFEVYILSEAEVVERSTPSPLFTLQIKRIDGYRDGGTTSIQTDKGEYTIDHRIGSITKGAWYKGYPRESGAVLATPEEKAAIKLALKEFQGGYPEQRDEIANG